MGKGDDVDESVGPGAAYMQFVLMEGIIEKLKLLDYEKLFCQELGFKPFSRFAIFFPSLSLCHFKHTFAFFTIMLLVAVINICTDL